MLEGLCLVTIVIVVILALVPAGTLACTSILVIPGASVDGSATVAHTADCGSCGIPQGHCETIGSQPRNAKCPAKKKDSGQRCRITDSRCQLSDQL